MGEKEGERNSGLPYSFWPIEGLASSRIPVGSLGVHTGLDWVGVIWLVD